jgi:hypothetical protein
MRKRRHHYVWQRYLSAWSVDDKVTCLRHGKLYTSNTTNIAVERDFYQIQALTDLEIQLVRGICEKATEPLVRKLHDEWMAHIMEIQSALRLVSAMSSEQASSSRGREASELLDEIVSNLEEDYHAKIESDFVEDIEALRRGEMEFLDDFEGFAKFAHYLAVQSMRTKKERDLMIGALPEHPDLSGERIWPVLSHVLATNVSYGIFRSHREGRITIMSAPAGVEFITSDSSPVNLWKVPGQPVDRVDLYYPVSPAFALRVELDVGGGRRDVLSLSVEEVEAYNRIIHSSAHEQTFASTSRILEALVSGCPR